jgi:hypothetical protein
VPTKLAKATKGMMLMYMYGGLYIVETPQCRRLFPHMARLPWQLCSERHFSSGQRQRKFVGQVSVEAGGAHRFHTVEVPLHEHHAAYSPSAGHVEAVVVTWS